MKELDLYLKLEKCNFTFSEVKYLDMIVKSGELTMDPVKIDGIAQWPISVMIFFLSSALFLISFFRATSPFPGSLSYAYHHYLLILGPLTFTMHTL